MPLRPAQQRPPSSTHPTRTPLLVSASWRVNLSAIGGKRAHKSRTSPKWLSALAAASQDGQAVAKRLSHRMQSPRVHQDTPHHETHIRARLSPVCITVQGVAQASKPHTYVLRHPAWPVTQCAARKQWAAGLRQLLCWQKVRLHSAVVSCPLAHVSLHAAIQQHDE